MNRSMALRQANRNAAIRQHMSENKVADDERGGNSFYSYVRAPTFAEARAACRRAVPGTFWVDPQKAFRVAVQHAERQRDSLKAILAPSVTGVRWPY